MFSNDKPPVNLPLATLLLALTALLSGCDKDPAPANSAANKSVTPTETAQQSTGLVKHAVKMTDTEDPVKWMDMASSKSPAQVAKEAKLAQDAHDAKLATDAKDARDAKLTADAKIAADAKAVADAKSAADAKVVADAKAASDAKAALAAQKAQAVVQAAAQAKPAPVVAQEPVLTVLSKEQPKFPKTAALEGVTAGTVTANMHIEPDGHVSKVDIVKASPGRYFDKVVVAAAMHWKYAPIAKQSSTTVQFDFKLDGDGS